MIYPNSTLASSLAQQGWQEKGTNDGCAVCDDGVVTLEMTVEGETHRRSKAFTAVTTAIDTVAFRFDVGVRARRQRMCAQIFFNEIDRSP